MMKSLLWIIIVYKILCRIEIQSIRSIKIADSSYSRTTVCIPYREKLSTRRCPNELKMMNVNGKCLDASVCRQLSAFIFIGD